MKRFLTALTVIIITVLAMPRVAFAADEPLESIPKRSNSNSSKAYCMYEENDGKYTLSCVNSAGTKLLYSSEEDFKHDNSFSKDGRILFYAVNDTVYRYSHESGKRQKIYAADDSNITLYSSPSGEYCFICAGQPGGDNKYDYDLVIWHNGKTVSQSENTDFYDETRRYYYDNRLYGINDRGEAFYTLDRDIYILDRSGKRLAQKAPVSPSDNDNYYIVSVFPGSGTYIVRNGQDIYFGAIDGEQHKMSLLGSHRTYVIDYNGKGLILYNGEYVARYDIKSGKNHNIVKMSPEEFEEKRYDFMVVSEDLNEVAFLNHSNKLVRMSGWDDENIRYTKKQEIMLNGEIRNEIDCYSSDLNIFLITVRDERGCCKFWTADFDSGSYVNTGRWDKVDRFGHIILNSLGINIINPDGSRIKVVDKDNVGKTCTPYLSNGFYIFYSGGPDRNYDYEGEYPLTYYYIDKNGNAVKWYEKTVYMEAYIEDCGGLDFE